MISIYYMYNIWILIFIIMYYTHRTISRTIITYNNFKINIFLTNNRFYTIFYIFFMIVTSNYDRNITHNSTYTQSNLSVYSCYFLCYLHRYNSPPFTMPESKFSSGFQPSSVTIFVGSMA